MTPMSSSPVIRRDDGGDGGADEEDGGQAAVGDPIVHHPVEPLAEHRAEDAKHLKHCNCGKWLAQILGKPLWMDLMYGYLNASVMTLTFKYLSILLVSPTEDIFAFQGVSNQSSNSL